MLADVVRYKFHFESVTVVLGSVLVLWDSCLSVNILSMCCFHFEVSGALNVSVLACPYTRPFISQRVCDCLFPLAYVRSRVFISSYICVCLCVYFQKSELCTESMCLVPWSKAQLTSTLPALIIPIAVAICEGFINVSEERFISKGFKFEWICLK